MYLSFYIDSQFDDFVKSAIKGTAEGVQREEETHAGINYDFVKDLSSRNYYRAVQD